MEQQDNLLLNILISIVTLTHLTVMMTDEERDPAEGHHFSFFGSTGFIWLASLLKELLAPLLPLVRSLPIGKTEAVDYRSVPLSAM